MVDESSEAGVYKPLVVQAVLYSICYGNEGVSSSVSDVGRYVVIRNSLDSIFQICTFGVHIRILAQELSFHRVAYTM
jgi:hypothetical protein